MCVCKMKHYVIYAGRWNNPDRSVKEEDNFVEALSNVTGALVPTSVSFVHLSIATTTSHSLVQVFS